MAMMHGRVFEKVGVNVSTVCGEFSPEFRGQIPGAAEDPRFWASGISLVAHLRSPLVPAVHMNTRHIVTTKAWFGGGADLTPMLPRRRRHARLPRRAASAPATRTTPATTPRFKTWCDEYFYPASTATSRAASAASSTTISTAATGSAISPSPATSARPSSTSIPALVRRHMNEPLDRRSSAATSSMRRGRYVEFNLLYDRGTLFGLKTGGNVEAILMSLPPEVAWP